MFYKTESIGLIPRRGFGLRKKELEIFWNRRYFEAMENGEHGKTML